MNIIIFGPPGAGKGTQAKYLVQKLNGIQISTGDILRNEIKKDSEIGRKIINDMSDGNFVSDEIVNKLIQNIIEETTINKNFIFDGYPRSISQAKNLDLLLAKFNLKIDFILFLNVNKETIVKRIEKRKVLEKRSDDNLNTILKRYETYMATTKPVLDFYSKKQNFHEIDGTLEIDEITRKIETFINV